MASTMVKIEDLKDFLINHRLVKKGQSVDENQSLLESGIIDSLAILEIISHIEKVYTIKVEDTDLIPANFDTLAAMKMYIEKKVVEGYSTE